MRIAAVYDSRLPNSNYRSVIPARELESRGHEVLWPSETIGKDRIDRLLDCDAVLLHRQYGPATLAAVPLLARSGIAVCWDNDDDLSEVPVESPHFESFAGERGERIEDAWKRIVRRAALVTTPSAILAEKFLNRGARHVEVIENHLPAEFLAEPRREHDGVVVGWTAGTTHAADAKRLGIPLVLRRLLDTYPDVHVASIGLNLELGHERYHHLERVDFDRLIHAAAAFDIGIAPLADIPFNRARSNVKVKEYSALGIPWLASPVGPYAELGPEQGGELVADGDWWEALVRLIEDKGERTTHGRRARQWAESESIAHGGDRWEAALEAALDNARELAANWRG